MKVAALESIAPLFRYPDAEFPEHLEEALRLVPALDRFARATAALDRRALEAIYTSTFDLAPACSPYLGVHLFGDDSRPRARLMLGLQRGGASGELPDHIAEVLARASKFSTEEWVDLETLVIVPALMRMQLLLGADNPYRFLIEAAIGEIRGSHWQTQIAPGGQARPLRPEGGSS